MTNLMRYDSKDSTTFPWSEPVAELQGMPGMHRHTRQFHVEIEYIYVFYKKRKKRSSGTVSPRASVVCQAHVAHAPSSPAT
jgi:hypothetical protein